MLRSWSDVPRRTLMLAIILLCGLTLSGCDALDFIAELIRFENDAKAQQDLRIETFSISASSFVITTNSDPTVDIKDEVTVYEQIDGNVSFTTSAGQSESFTLTPGDKVIERPAAGLVTIIRD